MPCIDKGSDEAFSQPVLAPWAKPDVIQFRELNLETGKDIDLSDNRGYLVSLEKKLLPSSCSCLFITPNTQGLGACSVSEMRATALQTRAPTGASPCCSAFPDRSVACSEYPKWIILCHVYRGCPGLLVCFGLFVPHMTCGQVFILVKGDPGEGKCIMLAGQERWWPWGKVTAVRDYLINMVVLCPGQPPGTVSGRGRLCAVAGDGSATPTRSWEPTGRAAARLLCCSPRTANPAKTRAGEPFPPFIRPVLGFELCDERWAQRPWKSCAGSLSQALSQGLPVALCSLLLLAQPLCLAHCSGW